jgi:hypothetical protein
MPRQVDQEQVALARERIGDGPPGQPRVASAVDQKCLRPTTPSHALVGWEGVLAGRRTSGLPAVAR